MTRSPDFLGALGVSAVNQRALTNNQSPDDPITRSPDVQKPHKLSVTPVTDAAPQ